eukprot:5806533-Pyramimonas_sp.AAC.1
MAARQQLVVHGELGYLSDEEISQMLQEIKAVLVLAASTLGYLIRTQNRASNFAWNSDGRDSVTGVSTRNQTNNALWFGHTDSNLRDQHVKRLAAYTSVRDDETT